MSAVTTPAVLAQEEARALQFGWPPPPSRQLVRAAARPPVPWKNGGGSTRELAIWPPGACVDDFVWRASVARIDAPGPFSVFAGIERLLTVIDGPTLELLESDNRRHRLARWDTLAFAGETPISVPDSAGVTHDFNLMWRRGAGHGSVRLWRDRHEVQVAIGSVVLYCAAGRYGVGGEVLEAGDAMVLCQAQRTAVWIVPQSADAVLLDAQVACQAPDTVQGERK